MNDTLKKYELMISLGIPMEIEMLQGFCQGPTWSIKCSELDINPQSFGLMSDSIATAILERACREWLEKEQSIYINADDQGFYYAFYMPRGTDPITGIECEYDAAQIAALEYCLKERTTQCTDN